MYFLVLHELVLYHNARDKQGKSDKSSKSKNYPSLQKKAKRSEQKKNAAIWFNKMMNLTELFGRL